MWASVELSVFPLEQGLPMSMYGGTMIPPHPQMAEAPGGPMYNGLHTTDPAWNPILKVVPSSADNSDPQQVTLQIHLAEK